MSTEGDNLSVNDTSSEEESSDDSISNDPATPLDTNQPVPIVTEWLRDIHLTNMSTTGTNRGASASAANAGGSFKVNTPTEFTGQRNQVKTFKLQCLTYINLNEDKLNTNRKQLLFITSYLRGPAYDWILPHLEDFLEHAEWNDLKSTTKTVMAGKTAFFVELQNTFGYGNEQMEAERSLQTIQQRGPVAKYKAEFLSLVVKTNWDDQAIASHFYRGLKDPIKDEIARRDVRPTTAQQMYEVAMKIDERFYERQMEKKGGFYPSRANTRVQRDAPTWRNDYYGLQKMQIDATKGKPGSNKPFQKKEQKRPQTDKGTKDKSKVECYECGKTGHYARECNARKQRHELQGSGPNKPRDHHSFKATRGGERSEVKTPDTETTETVEGTESVEVSKELIATQDKHALLSWTACYNDGCNIHLSDKLGSGYFPTGRRQSVCYSRGGPSQRAEAQWSRTLYDLEVTEEDLPNEPTSEDPEEENTESESEEETVTHRLPLNDVMLPFTRAIMRKKDAIFPWIQGVQHVNENAFYNLFEELRMMICNLPVQGTIWGEQVLYERVPFQSQFDGRRGYTTREGAYISPELRYQFNQLRREYERASTAVTRNENPQRMTRDVAQPNVRHSGN